MDLITLADAAGRQARVVDRLRSLQRRISHRCVLLACSCLLLAACGTNTTRAPVVDASSALQHYTVRGGDTLYSVAWRYGLTYQQLARANNIAPPYTIHPGQRLLISAAADSPAPPPPQRTTTATSTSKPRPVPKAAPAAARVPTNNTESWRWPTDGTMGARYASSGKVHKGIDIQGKLGQAVKVAKSGKVVYAGDGLKAYGLLVIVKHDERYLSAYAHNRKVLVREGDSVTAGQQIAAMGQRDDGVVMLHFEIRRDGKPRDPMAYLPAR